MMKITKILRNKLTFEDGREIPVNPDLIYEYGLKDGVELSEERYSTLLEESAYSKALAILARQERSEKGLIVKLRECFRDGALAEKVVNRVKKNGYLNDAEYAVSFLTGKNYSKKHNTEKRKNNEQRHIYIRRERILLAFYFRIRKIFHGADQGCR